MKPPAWKSPITCCLNCAERHAGCHGHCERYRAEKAAHEAETAKRHEAEARERDYRQYRGTLARRAKESGGR